VRCAQFGKDEVDLAAALAWLRDQCGIHRLLVEGGGHLNAALLQANLVDELYLTLCPLVFGGRTSPSLADGRMPQPLANAAQATLCSARRKGEELFLRLTMNSAAFRTTRHQPQKV
jgi:5-amino-6-(5-phosphoribosylamino)uracil reductase